MSRNGKSTFRVGPYDFYMPFGMLDKNQLKEKLFNRPGVAGAVLKTASSLID